MHSHRTLPRSPTSGSSEIHTSQRIQVILFLVAAFVQLTTVAHACPFCSALAPTLNDDLHDSSVAVLARVESVAEDETGLNVLRLRITEVFKGNAKLVNSLIEIPAEDGVAHEGLFWVVGYGEGPILWGNPKSTSKKAVEYLRALASQPEGTSKPLEYFLPYLQHPDELVAADAYNEFADASFEDIRQLKGTLDRDWIIEVVRDPSVSVHRRRLGWTLLSQCGNHADTKLFEELLRVRKLDEKFNPAMDSAISCFISLGGEAALARIERDFLDNPDADYLDVFAAVSAVRVHGTELKLIPRGRLAAALRKVLRRVELADLVIPDLARWEDWSAIEKIVHLFETATEETDFIKSVAVLYLKACPLPTAATALDRLRTLDPETVRAAEASLLFYPGVATIPVPPADDEEPSPALPEPASPRVAEKQSAFDDSNAGKKERR